MPTWRNFWIYLHAKNKLHLTSFLRYCKDIANLLLSVLCECLIIPTNRKLCWNQLVGNFDVYLHAKTQLDLTSFLRCCKDIANLLFWELCECLIISIKNHGINLKDAFMFIWMQKINFITHFFLKYDKRK